MLATFVTVNVNSGMRDAFVKAVLGDAMGSVKDEPGCFGFDERPNATVRHRTDA